MPFIPKDWRNAATSTGGGDVSTPLSAEALEDLEQRLAAYSDEVALVAGGPDVAVTLEAPLNVRHARFGATGDGSTDDTAAIQAAFNTPAIGSGATVFIPHGTYRTSATLEVKRGLVVHGESGSGWFGSTLLRPNAGVTAISVVGWDEYAQGTPNPGGVEGGSPGYTFERGDWTVIRDLAIRPISKSGTGHGINLNARAKIENVWISECSGNGIHLEQSIPSSTANNWYIGYCRIDENDGHGLFVSGNDANAGVAIGVDCSSNGGFGFWDETLLGNSYVGCHTSGNIGGGYCKPANHEVNTSAYFNCYTEGGQEDAIYTPAAVYGRVSGGYDVGNAPALEAAGNSGHFSSRPIIVYALGQHDVDVETDKYVQVGHSANPQIAFNIKHGADGEYRAAWNANHTLMFTLDSSGANQAFGLTGNGATEGPGQAVFTNGVMLNADNLARNVTSAGGAPTTGAHKAGDIVFNRDVAAGGFVGWVCTTAGTPGTWKTFGAVSA